MSLEAPNHSMQNAIRFVRYLKTSETGNTLGKEELLSTLTHKSHSQRQKERARRITKRRTEATWRPQLPMVHTLIEEMMSPSPENLPAANEGLADLMLDVFPTEIYPWRQPIREINWTLVAGDVALFFAEKLPAKTPEGITWTRTREGKGVKRTNAGILDHALLPKEIAFIIELYELTGREAPEESDLAKKYGFSSARMNEGVDFVLHEMSWNDRLRSRFLKQ